MSPTVLGALKDGFGEGDEPCHLQRKPCFLCPPDHLAGTTRRLPSLCSCKRSRCCFHSHSLFVKRRLVIERFASSNPGRSDGRYFYTRVKVCRLFLGVRSTPVFLQWHVKDPGHSTNSAGGRLHLNTHTPLTQRSRSGLTMPLVQAWFGNLSANQGKRNSSENTRPQSSQLAEPL